MVFPDRSIYSKGTLKIKQPVRQKYRLPGRASQKKAEKNVFYLLNGLWEPDCREAQERRLPEIPR